MPRNLSSSAFMKPFVVLALPGMYLFYKYSQYKRQQQEQNRRKVTERELAHLNHKIDKLLSKLEENEPELATSQEDECVICVNAKATMQTSPCGHRVVCRKCFVKTIQMAVSQRLLPLRCVICRAKILRLKQTSSLHKTWVLPAGYSVGGKSWVVPPSASQYSMAVPNSESLYSMASGSSSFSGVSSVSSATCSSSGSAHDKYRYPRQPVSGPLRKSQTQSMKYRLQEYKEPVRGEPQEKPRLTPIQEFQREFRAGKERSTSTRIRCAQKIVTQLETTPLVNNKTYFRSPLKPQNKETDKKKKPNECQKQRVSEERHKDEKHSDNKNLRSNEENIERAPTPSVKEEKSKKSDKKEKKEDNKENKKESKPEKPKEEKKELTKAEKKEIKKEAKAAKKEAKLEAKKEKNEKKEKSEKEKKEKCEKKDKKEESAKK